VAIIGSGPAGLASAYELAKFAAETKASIEITIIEKENRLGGRIKTVGKNGHFLPNIWKGDGATDAGAMSLPLTPQAELDCKYKSQCKAKGVNCDVRSMTDEDIQNLVHGTGGYEFVKSASFPHFLIRHYIKKFKNPVFRHNFGQTAHEIMGKLFVRNDNDEFLCKGCGSLGEDLNIDQLLLQRVERVEPAFADRLRKNNNGSLADAFEKAVDKEVFAWIDRNSVIMETDHAKLPQKLEAFKKFEEDWALTYRDHLKKRGWPENVIDIYESSYQCLTQYRIREDIVETTIGKWWQKNAMFSVRQGMHTVFQKPETPVPPPQTAFYDEILKLAKNNWNIDVKFLYNMRVEKIEKVTGGRVTLYKNAAPKHALWDRIDSYDAVISTIPPQFVRNIDIRVDGTCITPSEGLFEDDPLFKMMLQFKDPFWLNPNNNKDGFVIRDDQGFLTSTDVVGKLRYPRRTGEPGNIVMMYVFHENADAFAHKLTQQGFMKDSTANWRGGSFDEDSGKKEVLHMALEQLQRFHPRVNLLEKFTGNFFIQPWVQLSKPPSGFHQMTKVQKYCDASPQGIYFAGDGFSFKPQWIDGAFYTAFHAIYRLINDFTQSGKEDPFKTVLDKNAYSWV